MSATLLNLQVWQALGRWLALLARIDARRPASWLALLAAAGGVVSAALTPVPAAVALGWWGGTLAVVTALGELPDDEQWSGMPTPPWLAGRLLWPLAGWGLGWGFIAQRLSGVDLRGHHLRRGGRFAVAPGAGRPPNAAQRR